jgi:hypothetical protein
MYAGRSGGERRETADAAKRTRKSAKDHGARGVEHMRSIAIAIFPGVQALDVAGPPDVFADSFRCSN